LQIVEERDRVYGRLSAGPAVRGAALALAALSWIAKSEVVYVAFRKALARFRKQAWPRNDTQEIDEYS